ncbi:MAG: UbiD family decarboxylase, partial [Alphaproteobacteria bacterium]|nr:UbiD family decarboxylase [Alphaproteobacteria bacterium]
MALSSLRDFLTALERRGELLRVREPVALVHEMTEIQRRLSESGGPAVLFENPIGAHGKPHDIPVLANLYGTVDRVAFGLGRKAAELATLGKALADIAQPAPIGGLADAARRLPAVAKVLAMRPRRARQAPVQEV